jgi:hypothetical protein
VVSIVLILVAFILALLPLGIYLTWLAGLHRRPTAVVLSGPSDFLMLLAGLVGFFPTLALLFLFLVQSNSRLLLRWNGDQMATLWDEERIAWLGTIGFLSIFFGTVASATWFSRRVVLAVYNINRVTLEAVVQEVLTSLGLSVARFGNVWGDGRALLAMEPFDGLNYASLRVLTSDPRLAEEMLRSLRLRLANTPGANGPALTWLTTTGTACLGAALAAVMLLLYFVYLTRF